LHEFFIARWPATLSDIFFIIFSPAGDPPVGVSGHSRGRTLECMAGFVEIRTRSEEFDRFHALPFGTDAAPTAEPLRDIRREGPKGYTLA
jgi:hypothetical protein